MGHLHVAGLHWTNDGGLDTYDAARAARPDRHADEQWWQDHVER